MSEQYLKFVPGPASKSGKTKTWWVVQKQNEIHLGWIGWWGSWRRYAFYPKADTVYEEACLKQIATFIVDQTACHRQGAKLKRDIKKQVLRNFSPATRKYLKELTCR